MVARSNNINHPSGVKLKTPLLVPSFSSRGFEFVGRTKPEVYDNLMAFKEFITDSLLISAYDLHYEHIPKSSEFAPSTSLIFIDSGGYEVYSSTDFLGASKYLHPVKEWNNDLLNKTLSQWPDEYPAIIVNFDGKTNPNAMVSLDAQIQLGIDQFKQFPKHLHNFLIKPESTDKDLPIDEIVLKAIKLKDFHIIGMTEKELGNSILNRMVNIAKVRKALDAQNLLTPIHIFGSLDPITSTLYFLAGAEIFDGLTWLKYSYDDNLAIYTPNFGAKNYGISYDDTFIKEDSGKVNLYYLEKIKFAMLDFLKTNDFNEFERLGTGMAALFKKCYNEFEEHLNK